jgi:dephospho-CoA kinase
VQGLLQAVVEPELAMPLGWPAAPGVLRSLVPAVLRLRSRLLNRWQRLRPPQGSRFYSQRPTPSYGDSFRLEQLGPPAMLERLNRPRWTGRQRRIGLTGGIASGKSSAGALLAARGLPVLDADTYAREALAPGSPGARTVLARYGERVRATGTAAGGADAIDRAALGAIVFADPAERQWLERLVHPIVRARFAAELERLAAAPAVVLMIPLLFEAGLEELCSEVWLVDCDESQQLRRLMARDGLSEAEARARIAAQWPLERKRPLADLVIDNRGGPDALAAQLRQSLERGLRTGADPRAAAPPAP